MPPWVSSTRSSSAGIATRRATALISDYKITVILYEGILEEDADFRAQIPKSLPGVKDDSLFIGEPRRAYGRRRN
ncbi:hypothetical protein KXW65_004494 [Aspergillus fumigatus]|nr:hypothetical protein KXX31_007658 [Aspergillus fumigatus]KAH1673063.1 hypothetical protein KXX65_006212 [Aspergillus fumigatus]KAH2111234.1 hypothetical protein KXW65_004494 [Aspergillus fumigatus]